MRADPPPSFQAALLSVTCIDRTERNPQLDPLTRCRCRRTNRIIIMTFSADAHARMVARFQGTARLRLTGYGYILCARARTLIGTSEPLLTSAQSAPCAWSNNDHCL